MIYDKAKYHYEGDFPEGLEQYQAFVHTGMFLGWLIENDLMSPAFNEESEKEVAFLKLGEMTGTQIYESWDGVLASDMLNEVGDAFALYYYEEGDYFTDYIAVFNQYQSIYSVEDSIENYKKIEVVIQSRYEQWQKALYKGKK